MKKLVSLAMVLGLVLVTGVAFAADSNTLTVQASVTGTCKFSSGTSTLDFGALDQTSVNPASATASVTFWCTKNAAYTVTAGNGAHYVAPNRRMQNTSTSTEFIPYTLGYNPSSGQGTGKTLLITLNLSGTIANVDYVDVAAGAYNDSVTLSITP